jgi:hypothetical protein
MGHAVINLLKKHTHPHTRTHAHSVLLETVSVQQLQVQQPSTYKKPKAASAVLGSWWVVSAENVDLHTIINMK